MAKKKWSSSYHVMCLHGIPSKFQQHCTVLLCTIPTFFFFFSSSPHTHRKIPRPAGCICPTRREHWEMIRSQQIFWDLLVTSDRLVVVRGWKTHRRHGVHWWKLWVLTMVRYGPSSLHSHLRPQPGTCTTGFRGIYLLFWAAFDRYI